MVTVLEVREGYGMMGGLASAVMIESSSKRFELAGIGEAAKWVGVNGWLISVECGDSSSPKEARGVITIIFEEVRQ